MDWNFAIGGWRIAEEQFIKGTAQHDDKAADLMFIDPPPSRFDVRHNLPAHVGTADLQLGGQLLLSHPSAQAQFDEVLADVVGFGVHRNDLLSRPQSGRPCWIKPGRRNASGRFLLTRKAMSVRFIPLMNRGTNRIVAPETITPSGSKPDKAGSWNATLAEQDIPAPG
jgi:hypothetical protein